MKIGNRVYFKRTTILLIIALSISLCSCNDKTKDNEIDKILDEVGNKDRALISKGKDGKMYIIEEDGWKRSTFEENKVEGVEICRGTGFSFGKCIRKAIDSQICLFTYLDGDEYVAVTVKCPPNYNSN